MAGHGHIPPSACSVRSFDEAHQPENTPCRRDGHSRPSWGGIVGNQKFSNIHEEACGSYAQDHENFGNGSFSLARRTIAGPKSPRICWIYPRSITSDIDDSEVAPPQSVHDLCSCEIGAEEIGHFGRFVQLREVDRLAHLFVFGKQPW